MSEGDWLRARLAVRLGCAVRCCAVLSCGGVTKCHQAQAALASSLLASNGAHDTLASSLLPSNGAHASPLTHCPDPPLRCSGTPACPPPPRRYLWVRGINRLELYNEPDLDSAFAVTGGGYNASLWVDTLALRSRAIQDLYADMNADAAYAAYPPLTPVIHVGAFAKTTYGGGMLGQPTVLAQHQTFAAAANPDPSWKNLQTYSYHSYGAVGVWVWVWTGG